MYFICSSCWVFVMWIVLLRNSRGFGFSGTCRTGCVELVSLQVVKFEGACGV